MKIFKTVAEFQSYSFDTRKTSTIGFVPTMGALHAGHLALVKKALEENDTASVSIFVNPLQFNNPEDLKKYPRTIGNDLTLLEKQGATAVFIPDASEIYATKTSLQFNFGSLENVMEGKFRPGHFNGVAVIVSKLFHFAMPHRAYFGQKDLQQVRIVETLVNDLSFPMQLICCDTHRESDGLAMSSRNVRLSPEGRTVAPRLYEGLSTAAKQLTSGKSVQQAQHNFAEFIKGFPEIQLEYLEVVDYTTLESIDAIYPGQKIAICLAAFLDGVRLIDNVVVEF